ncbi:MAG: SDR family oxidoreductase [Chromatiales bacterium]|nr:MAG: SDR family oxidoreductase [Chromatiales bacterium]
MNLSRRLFPALLASLCCTISWAGSHSNGGTVLVIGATGETGKLVVARLVDEGYTVKAFVRDAVKGRKTLGKKVSLVTGDVTIPATIEPAFNGIDYVISAVGATAASGNNRPEKVDYEGVKHLADAAAAAGVKHFVLVSSMGVTHEDHQLNRFFGKVLIWKAQGEQALRDSGVPYTIVRPGGLINEPGGNLRVVAIQGDPLMDNARIPRADVAQVCIEALKSPAAQNKTLEVFTEEGESVSDWNGFFAALEPDGT